MSLQRHRPTNKQVQQDLQQFAEEQYPQHEKPKAPKKGDKNKKGGQK